MAPTTRSSSRRHSSRARLHPAAVTGRVSALLHAIDANDRKRWTYLGKKRSKNARKVAGASTRAKKNYYIDRANHWNRRQRKSKAIGRKAADQLNGAMVDLALLVRGSRQPLRRSKRRRS